MLSLVAYGNSDSENEDNISDNENDEGVDTVANVGSAEVLNKSNGELEPAGIFKSLPQPTSNQTESILEEEDEFLNKREVPTEKPKKQSVKITIPSLQEFESDEDEEIPKKKPKIDSRSCGLFSLLPPPKTTPITTKHFIPNVVKKNVNKKIKAPSTIKPSIVNNKKKEITENMDSEDDDEEIKNLPDTFDDDIWQKVCGRKEKRTPKPIIRKPVQTDNIIQSDPDVKKPYDGLDNQAFKELVGGNSKRKGEAIDILDINEDEILCDKKIWMTKSLTDPELAPKYVVKDPVNDTCKRKHHITYLAQQAKANEQELQNQWASSRFTRQKTQAKYGF